MISRVFWYQIYTYSSRFTVGIMGSYVKIFSVFLSVLVLFTSLIHSAYAVDNGNEEGSTPGEVSPSFTHDISK